MTTANWHVALIIKNFKFYLRLLNIRWKLIGYLGTDKDFSILSFKILEIIIVFLGKLVSKLNDLKTKYTPHIKTLVFFSNRFEKDLLLYKLPKSQLRKNIRTNAVFLRSTRVGNTHTDKKNINRHGFSSNKQLQYCTWL